MALCRGEAMPSGAWAWSTVGHRRLKERSKRSRKNRTRIFPNELCKKGRAETFCNWGEAAWHLQFCNVQLCTTFIASWRGSSSLAEGKERQKKAQGFPQPSISLISIQIKAVTNIYKPGLWNKGGQTVNMQMQTTGSEPAPGTTATMTWKTFLLHLAWCRLFQYSEVLQGHCLQFVPPGIFCNLTFSWYQTVPEVGRPLRPAGWKGLAPVEVCQGKCWKPGFFDSLNHVFLQHSAVFCAGRECRCQDCLWG